jgi:hypothetical protein
MLKKFIQASSIACLLAIGAGFSANAAIPSGGNEEDLAAPVGSFTSDIAIPSDKNSRSHQSRFYKRLALQQENGLSFGEHRGHQK